MAFHDYMCRLTADIQASIREIGSLKSNPESTRSLPDSLAESL